MSKAVRKAIIPAAGLGTRFLPMTALDDLGRFFELGRGAASGRVHIIELPAAQHPDVELCEADRLVWAGPGLRPAAHARGRDRKFPLPCGEPYIKKGEKKQ